MDLLELKVDYHYNKDCNMKCKYCSTMCRGSYKDEEVLETFKKICGKFKSVNLIGGEPFLHLELLIQLISIAKESGVLVSLVTNGLLLSQMIKQKNKIAFSILESIDSLELCVDSFTDLYNKFIGRVNGANKMLTESDIKLIASTAKKHNCKVDIKTVVTDGNKSDILVDKMNHWQINHWKVVQAYQMESSDLNVSDDDFKIYIKSNFYQNMEIDFKAKSRNSIINVIPTGELIIQNNKVVTTINASPEHIIELLKKNHFNFEHQDTLKRLNIPTEKYLSEIDFDIDGYLSKTKYIREGKAMFFDIEAISRPSMYAGEFGETYLPISVLWTGFVIEKDHPKIKEKISSTISRERNFEKIYYDFFNFVKKHHIECLVVSGGDLEKQFIEFTVYYLKEILTKEDIRYLFRLRDNVFDIQTIISQNIIHINDINLELNSNKSLNILRNIYPKHINYMRNSKKESYMISYHLDEIVYGGGWNDDKIQEIIRYCFEDIYEDFELYKFYDKIYKHHMDIEMSVEEIA